MELNFLAKLGANVTLSSEPLLEKHEFLSLKIIF